MKQKYKKFLNTLSQFFKDDTGQLSSTRLVFLSWSFGVLFTWLVICIKNKTLIDIPRGVSEITLVLMGGKVAGLWVEGNTPK